MSNLYLEHHGIKGMKWGVRRYQNPDGSLTAAGKKRYGSNIQSVKKRHLTRQINSVMRNEQSESHIYDKNYSDKIRSELDKTEVGKKKKNLDHFLANMLIEAKLRGGPNAQLVVGKEDAEFIAKIQNDYSAEVQKRLNTPQFKSKMATTLIKDMGYEYTDSGRKYVEEILDEYIKRV